MRGVMATPSPASSPAHRSPLSRLVNAAAARAVTPTRASPSNFARGQRLQAEADGHGKRQGPQRGARSRTRLAGIEREPLALGEVARELQVDPGVVEREPGRRLATLEVRPPERATQDRDQDGHGGADIRRSRRTGVGHHRGSAYRPRQLIPSNRQQPRQRPDDVAADSDLGPGIVTPANRQLVDAKPQARCQEQQLGVEAPVHHPQAREDGRGRLGGETLEAAGEVRDVDAADRPRQQRESATEELAQRRLMLLDLCGRDATAADDDVAAALKPRQARRHELEGRRQVDVHEQAIATLRGEHARSHGAALSAMRLSQDPAHPGWQQLCGQVRGAVHAAVVDDDQLARERSVTKPRDKSGQRRLEALRLVEDRDDERQRGRRAFGDRRGSGGHSSWKISTIGPGLASRESRVESALWRNGAAPAVSARVAVRGDRGHPPRAPRQGVGQRRHHWVRDIVSFQHDKLHPSCPQCGQRIRSELADADVDLVFVEAAVTKPEQTVRWLRPWRHGQPKTCASAEGVKRSQSGTERLLEALA